MRDAILSVDAQGTITDITATDAGVDALPGVEFYAGLLIPAMVNAHCHLELSAMCGRIAPGGGFAGFARSMACTRRDVPERAAAIALQDARMWREGIGAVADICNGDSTFSVKSHSPIEYLSLLELFGLHAVSAAPLAALEKEARRLGLRHGVTPHSTYSLQPAAFADAAAGDASVPLSVHFMESPGEAELFAGHGELHDWYASQGMQADFRGFGSPAERIIAQIPADRSVMLVHNTCITGRDIDLLTAHFGDRVTFVLCPRSNACITGLQPPAELLRRKGVRIALGTDSLASNDSLSMVEEMKMLPGVPLEELLGWATAGGARALGLGDRYGSLETGKAPGIALLTGIDWKHMTLLPHASARRLV